MHELALSESIVDLVVSRARQEHIARVSRVIVEIGIAASVEPQALEFCFSITAEDTVATGAELVIDVIGLQASCEDCGDQYAPATVISPCPSCGSFARKILTGRELRVISFEGE
jgi:hydrogenase nickel incorporation protein HypA/HybF